MRGVWHALAGGSRSDEVDAGGEVLDAHAVDQLRRTLNECVAHVGGEVSARRRAASIGETYLGLNEPGKLAFLRLLATEFGTSREAIVGAMRDHLAAVDDAARQRAERALRDVLTSPRSRILPQFSTLPEGVQFLVQMRADVLGALATHPEVAPLNEELLDLLTSWFDVGLLSLQRITWDSPAALLEKLMGYEAVHEIRSWNDLRNRLDSDRRLYAFFHPRMPKDPLIFIQVALVGCMADNIQHLLDEGSPTFDAAQADTAVFYSISSTQAGLRGVPLGNFLIKRVVDSLRQDFPKLRTFATLSPMPMFRRWLEQEFADHPERSRVTVGTGKATETLDLAAALKQEAWHDNLYLSAALEGPLLQLCAEFLLATRREGRPIDPVARFHLGNGARVERINWLADTSAKGLRQSFGIMVNYVYALDEIESNHEAYERDGEVIASSAVRKLKSRPVRVAG